jgi:hypothetical protein
LGIVFKSVVLWGDANETELRWRCVQIDSGECSQRLRE